MVIMNRAGVIEQFQLSPCGSRWRRWPAAGVRRPGSANALPIVRRLADGMIYRLSHCVVDRSRWQDDGTPDEPSYSTQPSLMEMYAVCLVRLAGCNDLH